MKLEDQRELIERIQTKDRFEKLKDGWIRDHLLWLDWGPTAEKRMDFKAAEEYCKAKGGRLPTIDELRLLIDYQEFRPAVNKDFFGDTKFDDWYWSGTKCVNPNWSSYAWCVFFGNGVVLTNRKDTTNYVRPVRASQERRSDG